MPTPPITLIEPPITATGMAACVLAMLALLFAVLWRRDREPGMGWLGLGFGLLALWFANASRIPPADVRLVPSLRGWWSLLSCGVAGICWGLVDYLAPPRAWRRWLALMLLPALLLVLALFAGLSPPRLAAAGVLMLPLMGAALLALRSRAAEPGAGHGIIGCVLLTVPGTFVVLALMRTDIQRLRYVAVMALVFFGLTLLTVSLLRRRRAIEAENERRTRAEAALALLNRDLEHTVAERTAELRDLVDALEAFNRSVSHDLRGPLGGIAGLARMAHEDLERGDPTLAKQALPAIAARADDATRLVAALLALARAGDARVAHDRVALGPLADSVIQELGSAGAVAEGDRPDIVVEPLPEVVGDVELLRPVLVNLIGNAVKFSRDAASPRITVRAEVVGNEVTVQVSDNGVGFEPAVAHELFQPFRRLHASRFEGHGVGLSIVRRAIERQGGRVWAEGRPGQGATFSFTLPRAA